MIIPSILTNDIPELKQMLVFCEGVVERVHIDIIDGIFADNKTADPLALQNFESDLSLDFHLMVKEPVNWVEKCVSAQADRVIGQIEMMKNQLEFIAKAQSEGVGVGLAIDADTSINLLDEEVFLDVDVILIMSVKAGFGGQDFRPEAISKIEKLDNIRKNKNLNFQIIVDGGINTQNIGKIKDAGADKVVVGRRLFDGDIKENVDKFTRALG